MEKIIHHSPAFQHKYFPNYITDNTKLIHWSGAHTPSDLPNCTKRPLIMGQCSIPIIPIFSSLYNGPLLWAFLSPLNG